MGKPKTNKEQQILENVLKAELDFISYVDVNTGEYRVILTNEETEIAPSECGSYAHTVADDIQNYIHKEDREYCTRQFELSNIQKELETKERMVVAYRLLCKDMYRRKEVSIFYHEADKDTLVFVRRDVTDSYEEEQKQKERLLNYML